MPGIRASRKSVPVLLMVQSGVLLPEHPAARGWGEAGTRPFSGADGLPGPRLEAERTQDLGPQRCSGRRAERQRGAPCVAGDRQLGPEPHIPTVVAEPICGLVERVQQCL